MSEKKSGVRSGMHPYITEMDGRRTVWHQWPDHTGARGQIWTGDKK